MVEVHLARHATAELVDALNRLVPQLSSTAPVLARSDVAAMIESPATHLFVATSDDEIVGTLTLAIFRIPSGVRAWIEDVVVDSSLRGRGVGEALTVAALDEARRCGARTVDLTSRPSRVAANALYQKLCFEQRDTNVYRLNLESAIPRATVECREGPRDHKGG
jgi:ribosomal protein S18 acetylase RimI-like enzyme